MNYLSNSLKNVLALSLFLLLFSNVTQAQNRNTGRQRLLMDFNWEFQLGDHKGAEKNSFNDSGWWTLNLPHDWSIKGKYTKDAPTGGSGGYLPTGIGWYRKHFEISKVQLNKKIWIEFDGVYMNSDVWINNHHLGNHPYGYTSFYYDLTPYLKEGENIIAVRVDNSEQPNTRWYSGSGIYRNVWLVIMNPLHIQHWGVTVTTPNVSPDSATVKVVTHIENSHKNLQNAKLLSIITDMDGHVVAKKESSFSLEPEKHSKLTTQLKVLSPQLWSLKSPNLYKLHSIIVDKNKQVDKVTTVFGIRSIRYDVNKGFFLNGKHVKMTGVCLHHDGGCVGAAVPVEIWERRLKKLKEMGCNAIRTSHNPRSPEFMALCDKMGFLVMDEAFDEWTIGKRKYGYHIYFAKWANLDLRSMIERDRNHPCVVLWSVGNEIPDQKTKEGAKTLRYLVNICHQEDPTRPVTSACDDIAADGGSTTLAFLNGLDIVGYNYVDRWHERRELYYSIDHHDHPNWKMIGTESVSIGGFRGGYSLGKDSSVVKPNYNYWMIRAEQLWKFVKVHDYVIGDFMWTGIDYLGEAFWPYKSSFSGVMDLCGFPKDGYYFYQSQWTKKPMIHLFPHWNWPGREGQVIPVLCYTNCDSVELFLNGKSFGVKSIEFPRQGNSGKWNKYAKPKIHPTTADLHLEWDVPYKPGILKAVGKKDGKVVCVQEIRTAGKPAALRLSVDRDTIIAGRYHAASVKVEVVDSSRYVVPTADNLVKFNVEGQGKIIGVDNGDPMDHAPYKALQRKAFNGLCLAVVQSSNKTGKIKFKASSKGLKSAAIEINVKQGPAVPEVP